MLTRELIRQKDTISTKRELVPVPQWGGNVLIRPLTVIEQERFWDILEDIEKGVVAPAGKRGSTVLMVAMQEDGQQMFKAEDAEWLGSGANIDAVGLIHKAIMRLSGITTEEQVAAAKKPETQTNSSSTGAQTDGASPTSKES